jgi:hypothetical protein
MADDAPGTSQLLGGIFQRLDEIAPGHLRHRCFECADQCAGLFQQGVHGRRDVLGADGIKMRQTGKIEQRVIGWGDRGICRCRHKSQAFRLALKCC